MARIQWSNAVIYISVSILLAIVAFCVSPRHAKKAVLPTLNSSHAETLSFNATRSLRLSGYNAMAALLQSASERYLGSAAATIFAVPDQAIQNVSMPSLLIEDFLKYHASPTKISAKDLLQKPIGFCFPSSLRGKNLSLTNADRLRGTTSINGIDVVLPDVSIEEHLAIHGVSAPFFFPGPRDMRFDPPNPYCRWANVDADVASARRAIPWHLIIRLLSSKGFISFSIGLHTVLEEILEDIQNLNSVTIFAPREDGFAYVASPSPLLQRIVKSHLLPYRLSFHELAQLPELSVLHTLVPGQNLTLHSNTAPNRVDITEPDVILFNNIAVHGVSHAFEVVKLASIS